MTRKIVFLAAIAVAVTLSSTVVPRTAYAQLSKKQSKQLKKELDKQYKKKIKEYKAEKWSLSGSSRTIDVALLEHYAKLAETDQNVEFVGEVSQCQSINICGQSALNNAQNRYVALASDHVKRGITDSVLRGDAIMPQTEIDNFTTVFANRLEADVGSVLTPSYSIVRDNGTTREYKTFFIMNEENAGAVRRRAMDRSISENKKASAEAEALLKLVDEHFSLD